jgi:diguanylate cyclase (GGDEF)-like protein/PAS domain S-box-containing protein
MENALKESEEKYRNILENIEDGYFEVDLAGKFTFFNDSLCRIIGYSKEEMMGMNNRVYMDPENAKKLYEVFNCVYRTGIPTKGFDWEIIRKNGSKRFIESSVTLIRDSLGQLMGFRGVARDITDRKQIDMAVRESERRTREMLENVELIVVGLDARGMVNYVNPFFLQETGYSAEEVLGKDWFAHFLPKKEVIPVQAVFHGLMEEGFHRHYENPILTRLGEERLIAWNNTVLRDEKGSPIGTLSIGKDITDQKRIEELLRRLSTQDGLTGIANRRHFDEFLNREWRRALRNGSPFSLIMADIDYFKAYNDTYGHQMGDECLRQIASTLKQTLNRPEDLVARYGGEEFAVVLPGTKANGAVYVAETLRTRVENLGIPHASSGISPVVTISLGIASLIPVREHSPEMLISASDQALYQAKSQGRNRIVKI